MFFMVSEKFGTEKVSEPVSKKMSTGKGLGIGLEKFWYRKKSRNRYRSDFGSRHSLIPEREQPAYKSHCRAVLTMEILMNTFPQCDEI